MPRIARTPAAAVIKPPAWLLPVAVDEWRRVAPGLLAAGSFTDADVATLGAFCQAVAHLRAAEEFMRQHGTVYSVRDDKGNLKFTGLVPQWFQARKAEASMLRCAAELGLTPASRAKLNRKRAASTDVDENLSALLRPRLAE